VPFATGGYVRDRVALRRDQVTVMLPLRRRGAWAWGAAAACAAVLIALSLIVRLTTVTDHSSHGPLSPPAPAVPAALAPPPVAAAPAAGLTSHSPITVIPPGTPIQQEYDQAFTQGLGNQPGMTAARSLAVPGPAVSGGWPALPTSAIPEEWAGRFVAGLLDVNYSRMSIATLGAWIQAQEAPELLPGVPAAVADKVLFISLLDPGLFGGQPTPVPSAAQWQSLAQAGARQSVSDLLIQTDPAWAQMTAAGWQPTDARTTELDISGLLTVSKATTTAATTHHFGLQVIVASARWHDGYGTVATAGWEET
jgi:hypothetical protein